MYLAPLLPSILSGVDRCCFLDFSMLLQLFFKNVLKKIDLKVLFFSDDIHLSSKKTHNNPLLKKEQATATVLQ